MIRMCRKILRRLAQFVILQQFDHTADADLVGLCQEQAIQQPALLLRQLSEDRVERLLKITVDLFNQSQCAVHLRHAVQPEVFGNLAIVEHTGPQLHNAPC